MVMDLQGKEHKKQKESTLRLFGQTIDIGQLKEKEKVRPKKDEKRNEDEREAKKPMEAVECPRCKSMDTKFCYFNNYNVNQPRHYCRKCQRYWTAGGALRNVPVGAGRRKQKPTFLPQNPPPFNSLFNPRPNPIPETLLPSRNPNPITTPRSKSYSPSFAGKTPSPQCHLSSSHSSSRSSFTLNFVNSGQSDWTLSCDENPATSSAFLPEKHLAKRTRIFLQSEEEDSSEGANSNPFSMDLDVAERALMRSDNMQKEVREKCSEIVSYSLNSNPSKSNSSSLRVLC